MRLRLCTITGADETVAPGSLASLSEAYPHAEWAVLYSPDREGTLRYPGAAWRETFALLVAPRARTAIHLCGEAVRQFEECGLDDIIAPFERIQLNFSARRYKGNVQRLAERAARTRQTVIVQAHPGNGDVYKIFAQFGPVEVLHDCSGGRGIAAEGWLPPFEVPTGYAGGLHPDMLQAQLRDINAAAGDAVVWCDMESSVRHREDESFSLIAAEKALEVSGAFLM